MSRRSSSTERQTRSGLRWRRRRGALPLGLPLALLAGLAPLAAASSCTSTAAPAPAPKPSTTQFRDVPEPTGQWPYPNGDLANTRDAAGSTITSLNVGKLKEAWSFQLTGTAAAGVSFAGAFAANPVVVNGTVYIQDLDCNVYAVDLATGREDWEYPVGQAETTGPGPNGVAVANGVVYGTTPTTVFALDASTGKTIWTNTDLLPSGQGTFEIQPQVVDGKVFLASAYGLGPGGGVAMALNAATGKKLWSFNTVAAPTTDTGVAAARLGSGGAWETPLVADDGSVTFGIGNPYQTAESAETSPNAQLYTDSEVNLDAATGKLRWYYQAVPNDFDDWDMQASPIATEINGTPVVIGAGKMGIVYAMNARTGQLLWKTPVGLHNGHDDLGLDLLEHKTTLTVPLTMAPGPLGGILTDMALADGTIYADVLNVPVTLTSLSAPAGKSAGKPSGEIVAVSLATGHIEWNTPVPSLPLGAATVSNDLVVTTLENGALIALNRTNGEIISQLQLPAPTNAPIAIAGNSVIIPAGAPQISAATTAPGSASAQAQLVAYSLG